MLFFILSVLYLIFFFVGNQDFDSKISSIWPASGLALAGYIIFGHRFAIPILSLSLVGAYALFHGWDTFSWQPRIAILSVLLTFNVWLQTFLITVLLKRWEVFKDRYISNAKIWIFISVTAVVCFLCSITGALILNFDQLSFHKISDQVSNPNQVLLWWTGQLLGILLVTPWLVIVQNSEKKLPLNRSVINGVVLPFLATLVTFYALQGSFSESIKKEAHNSFSLISQAGENRIKKRIQSYLLIVYELHLELSANPEISREEFKQVAYSIMKDREGIASLSWAEAFTPDKTQSFLEEVRQEHSDFQIWGDYTDPSEPLVVIKLIEPFESAKQMLGYNAFSVPFNKYALLEAKFSKSSTASDIFALRESGSTRKGFIIIKPVFQRINDDSNKQLFDSEKFIGVATGAFYIDDLLGSSLANDVTDILQMYVFENGNLDETVYGDRSLADSESGRKYQFDVNFANKLWTFVLHVDNEELFGNQTSRMRSFFLGEAIVAMFLVYIVVSSYSRKKQLEETVQTKTSELLQANVGLERANKDIAKVNRRISLASEAAEIGVWDWDVTTGYVHWESQMYKIFHVSKDEFDNTYATWRTYLHPEDCVKLERESATSINDGIMDIVLRIIRGDGELRYIHSIAEVVADQHTDTLHIVGVNIDITEQVLASRELEEAKSKAEQSSKAKSEFLSNMSHEIRTPLNGVIGLTELLLGTPQSSKQRQYTQNLLHSSQSLLRIINDILDFSKLESSQFSLQSGTFRLSELVDVTQASLGALADKKGLGFNLPTGKFRDVSYDGDVQRIQQVLFNLVGNAIKFTPHGEVTLDIQVKEFGDGSDRVLFRVNDSGIGLDESQKERIFERFTQADSSTTRLFGGTGLGLAISKKLVDLMGGSIGVESAPNQGSTFWFSLLLKRSLDQSQSDQEPLLSQSNDYGLVALVVEDNRVNQMVAGGLLNQLGVEVCFANNGQEAVTLAEERAFDVIFMDCQMPVLNGFDATRKIQSGEAGNKNIHTPIIAMTANAMPGDREACLECGMIDYLAKPIQSDELEKVIEKQLAERLTAANS